MEWAYYTCDVVTGRVTAQLPLVPPAELQRHIGASKDADFELPITDRACPADWELCTTPRRTLLVAEADGAILWSGIVWVRTRTQDDVVRLDCATPESYLEARYVDGALGPYVQTAQSTILAALITEANVSGIDLIPNIIASTVLRDRQYDRYSDQQILDMIEELSESDGGFEWTIDTRWADDPTEKRAELVFRAAAPTIGSVSLNPAWTFSHPGNLVSFEVVEDYSPGAYANVVVAGGEGEGQADGNEPGRIMSTSGAIQELAELQYGNPLMEYRHPTQLKSLAEVDAAARGKLTALKRGTVTAKVKARLEDLNLAQWSLGDTCRLMLTGGGYPDGYDAVWRVIGWGVDPQSETMTPELMPYVGV